jgi:dTMP kinase
MSKKGLLVVIEGLDGSGKGTQLQLLKEFLEKEGIHGNRSQIELFSEQHDEVYSKNLQVNMLKDFLKGQKKDFEMYDFPRYYDNYWGKMVGKMLAGDFGVKINPYFKSIYFLLDQADASKQIKKDLAQGKIVICNRFITSSYIFQKALIRTRKDKEEFEDWLEKTGYEELGIARPDVVIALYVKPEVAQELILKKNKRAYLTKTAKDLNERNLKMQIRAGFEMRRLCRTNKKWHLINCMDGDKLLPIEAVSEKIKDLLRSYL